VDEADARIASQRRLALAWHQRAARSRLPHDRAHVQGKHNGKLKAPHRQLVEFGVGGRYVSDAIGEAEEHGLIDCARGGRRVANLYTLTWLFLHDGAAASNRWRDYVQPAAELKSRNLPDKGKALLRSSYQGGDGTTEPEVREPRLPWSTPTLTELHGDAKAEVLAWGAGKPGDEPELPAFPDRRPAAARAA
jgi:hypothetical protein